MAQLAEPSKQWGVSRGFGPAAHNGIDYKYPSGTPVYAAAPGIVDFEGNGARDPWTLAAGGIYARLRHSDMFTGYAHLSSTVINKGQQVAAGQLIGYSGSTGNSTGPHLHFEVLPLSPNFRNGYSGRIDPAPYFSVAMPQGDKVVDRSDLDHIYQYGPLGRPRGAGEGEDVYIGKKASFVIADHVNSQEGRNRAAALAAQANRAAQADGLSNTVTARDNQINQLNKLLSEKNVLIDELNKKLETSGGGVDVETKTNIKSIKDTVDWIKDKLTKVFK